jgi:hypothetical protein
VALAGGDASLFDRYLAKSTAKSTLYREAQRAYYLDLPVMTHDPGSPGYEELVRRVSEQ